MIAWKIFFLAAVTLFPAGSSARDVSALPVGDSPAIGPADAKVTIVEFIDFQ